MARRDVWPQIADYDALVDAERTARAVSSSSVCFVTARPKPSRARRTEPVELAGTYEGRIALRGEVPCLPASYHDLFNVVAWAAFPRAKRAVHARQFRAIQKWLPEGSLRIPNRRTREQDALTILDEGGAALVVTRAFLGRLAQSEPLATSIEGDEACLVLFGHALMQHVSFESTSIRAAALVVVVDERIPSGTALLDVVDAAITGALSDGKRFQEPGGDRLVLVAPNAAWT